MAVVVAAIAAAVVAMFLLFLMMLLLLVTNRDDAGDGKERTGRRSSKRSVIRMMDCDVTGRDGMCSM